MDATSDCRDIVVARTWNECKDQKARLGGDGIKKRRDLAAWLSDGELRERDLGGGVDTYLVVKVGRKLGPTHLSSIRVVWMRSDVSQAHGRSKLWYVAVSSRQKLMG